MLLSAIRRDWGTVQWCGDIFGQLEYTLAQSRDVGDMESVVILEKRLLGFQAVYGEWIDRSAKHAKLPSTPVSKSARSGSQKPRVSCWPKSSRRSSATLG